MTRIAVVLVALLGCGQSHAPLEPLVPTPAEAFRETPPELAADSAPALPRIETTTLENGLSVWSAPAPSRVVTACFVSRRAGSDVPVTFADQPALLYELLLDREPLVRDSDATAITGAAMRLCVDVLPDELSEAMAVLASLVTRTSHDPARVEMLRDQRLASRERALRRTGRLAVQLVSQWLLGPHRAWGAPVEDVVDGIGRLDADWTEAMHRRAFAPSDSAIIVSGAIDPSSAFEIARSTFESWTTSSEPLFDIVPHTPPDSSPDVLVVETSLRQPLLFTGFTGPPLGHPDSAAFEVLSEIWVGLFGSRLNLALREEMEASYGVHEDVSFLRDRTLVVVISGVDRDATVDAAERVVAETERMTRELVSAGELSAARNTLRERLRMQTERTATMAVLLADGFGAGLTPDFVVERDRRLAAVTAEDVRRAAQNHLAHRAPLVVLATPPVAQELKRSSLEVVIRSDENARR